MALSRSLIVVLTCCCAALSSCAEKGPSTELKSAPPALKVPLEPDLVFRRKTSEWEILQKEGKDRIHFDNNSDTIADISTFILSDVISWFNKYCSGGHITIQGHTDEIGVRAYNLALSKRRALAAARYLVAHGIDATQIRVVGYGQDQPVVLGHNEAAYAQNRRVVVVPDGCH